MGVYIHGMEMPTSCEDCPMCHSNAEYDYAYCCVSSAETSGNKIPSDCPLVPVPPHGRLIDKDALEADISASVVFSGRDGNAEIVGAKKIINRLHLAPTIIPAEEVEES